MDSGSCWLIPASFRSRARRRDAVRSGAGDRLAKVFVLMTFLPEFLTKSWEE